MKATIYVILDSDVIMTATDDLCTGFSVQDYSRDDSYDILKFIFSPGAREKRSAYPVIGISSIFYPIIIISEQ